MAVERARHRLIQAFIKYSLELLAELSEGYALSVAGAHLVARGWVAEGWSMKSVVRRALVLSLMLLVASCLLWVSSVPAADTASGTWAGRWQGPMVITTGPGTGSTLPCEFLITDNGSSFSGTVACPGFGPIGFTGTEGTSVNGAAWGGISFGGYRQGDSASGTWTYPERGNSGTWSATRAAAPQ